MSNVESLKERSKNLLVYGGITATLGAALLGVGGSVFAQDTSTPTVGTDQTTETTDASTADTTREQAYADFLDALAANLGVADGETVDAAIRTTLKQMVDERLAAGEISADAAADLKTAIDSGDYPVFFHAPGMAGDRHMFGPGGRGGHGGQDDVDGPRDADDDASGDRPSGDTTAPDTGTPAADTGVSA